MHHPAILSFPRYSGSTDAGFAYDFVGAKIPEYLANWSLPELRSWTAPLPEIGEEYFEWIDLIEAATAAHDCFTFVELGAGYGRWSARAAMTARRLGKAAKLCLVEAEPSRVELIHEVMRRCEIPADSYTVQLAAVGAVPGTTPLLIKHPGIAEADWWGQAKAEGRGESTGESYFGFSVRKLPNGASVIEVPQISIVEAIRDYERVDLMDIDIQNAEGEAIEGSVPALVAKVSRLHIGTHSNASEQRIKSALAGTPFNLARDFPCFSHIETEFGPVDFEDGVQTWINSAL